MNSGQRLSDSFRDPEGYIFIYKNEIYRRINIKGKNNYDLLMGSGLYKELVSRKLLVQHDEINLESNRTLLKSFNINNKNLPNNQSYKIIKPDKIPFITYPYEWCFSQLKNAALTTLEIQKTALKYNMSLKDCSAYNIQFKGWSPVLIDTLSFEKYKQNEPWPAYGQFCRHFLAPLALMKYKDARLIKLLQFYIDGMPLDLTSNLLPFYSLLSFPLLTHIYFHSRSERHLSYKHNHRGKVTKHALTAIIDSLESAVKKFNFKTDISEWSNYYDNLYYSNEYFKDKITIVSNFLDVTKPNIVWDIGANTGILSRIASKTASTVISIESDSSAAEKNYQNSTQANDLNIYNVYSDIANPSPGIGWENEERLSLIGRGPADMAFALSLVHHLAIGNNIPLENIKDFFHRICKYLIIEFIPKTDPMLQKLLIVRKDIFPDYNQKNFEKIFRSSFRIKKSIKIKDTQRILYLMVRK